MSDDFEDQLKRWLRQRAGDDRTAVQALAGNVAALPPRRGRSNRLVPLAAGIALLVGMLWLLSPRLGSVTNQAASTPTNAASPTPAPPAATPGGPAAFAGDPRLSRCFGTISDMEFVFEMKRARDYQQYLPNMLLAPELDVDDPAFVVIFREGWAGPLISGVPGAKPETPMPGRRFVCVIVVGGDPSLYANVDITGLTLDVVPSSPSAPTAAVSEPPQPSGPTPSPAPAWYAGAEVLLECRDGQGEFGKGWQPGDLGTSPMSSGQRALANLLDQAQATTSSFPTTGFRLADSTDDGELYTYTVDGSIRAVVVTRSDEADGSGSWRVTSVAACEPGEMGPDLPIGAVAGVWRDPTGAVVPSDVVSETADCYRDRMLRVNGRLFVWDPNFGPNQSYDPTQLDATITDDSQLPSDAIDTSYASSGRHLYLARDGSAAYLVRADRTEQWAHVKGDEYQRTDCN